MGRRSSVAYVRAQKGIEPPGRDSIFPNQLSNKAGQINPAIAVRVDLPGRCEQGEQRQFFPHPLLQAKNAGTLLAQSRNEKVGTFWSLVIATGLPIMAALTPPDAAGMMIFSFQLRQRFERRVITGLERKKSHGPWSGKQLAQTNRALISARYGNGTENAP